MDGFRKNILQQDKANPVYLEQYLINTGRWVLNRVCKQIRQCEKEEIRAASCVQMFFGERCKSPNMKEERAHEVLAPKVNQIQP